MRHIFCIYLEALLVPHGVDIKTEHSYAYYGYEMSPIVLHMNCVLTLVCAYIVTKLYTLGCRSHFRFGPHMTTTKNALMNNMNLRNRPTNSKQKLSIAHWKLLPVCMQNLRIICHLVNSSSSLPAQNKYFC